MELISGSDFTIESDELNRVIVYIHSEVINVYPNLCDNTGNPVILLNKGRQLEYGDPVLDVVLEGGLEDQDDFGPMPRDDFYIDDFYPRGTLSLWWTLPDSIEYEAKTIDDIRFNIENHDFQNMLEGFINEHKEEVAQMLTNQNNQY